MANHKHAPSLRVYPPTGKRWIYVLRDPFTQEIRYVGCTFTTVRDRLLAHISGRANPNKAAWLKDLKRRRKRPLAEVIDCVDDRVWEVSENWWIEHLSGKFRLVNAQGKAPV